MLRVPQHEIEPSPRLSQESTDASAAVMSRPKDLLVVSLVRVTTSLTRPGLAAGMRLLFRVPVGLALLLGRSIEQYVSRLLQLSCHPASAFNLRHPFILSFSSISLFESVLLGAVSSGR